MDAYERFECWGSLENHLRTGWSLDQSSRRRQIIEEQRKEMKGQAHLGTIELVNERTIKTTSSITDLIGCHIMKSLFNRYFKEKEKKIRDTHETKPFCCYWSKSAGPQSTRMDDRSETWTVWPGAFKEELFKGIVLIWWPSICGGSSWSKERQ